jgi:hypothetical protein
MVEFSWDTSFRIRTPRQSPIPLSSHPDLLEPHILWSLSNVKAVSVYASCTGSHMIVPDIKGIAWLFGRNQLAVFGVPGINAISENAPRSLGARDLGALEHQETVA